MSRNYKFHTPEGVYFISFAVVGWLNVFTRNEYKVLLIDSLHYLVLPHDAIMRQQGNKGRQAVIVKDKTIT